MKNYLPIAMATVGLLSTSSVITAHITADLQSVITADLDGDAIHE